MQFLVIACALLGVALGQYAGYTGYPGYTAAAGYPGYAGYGGYRGYAGYPGYTGYNGYAGAGYPGYAGYAGYPGYAGYQGYRGWPQFPGAIKPVETKEKEASKTVVPIAPIAPFAPFAPVVPAVAPVAPVAAKTWSGPYPAIRSQTQGSSPDGSYSWSYETENGIGAAAASTARFGQEGENDGIVAGEWAYTSPDGTPVHVRYTADKDGFHPEILSPNYNGYLGGARSVLPIDAVLPIVAPVAPVEKIAEETEKKEE